MPEYRCKCGRRLHYNQITGKIQEVIDSGDTIIKIRCSNATKQLFKQLKKEKEMPSYEALLQLLMMNF